MTQETQTALARRINGIEEAFIAATLGVMTLITFANVVARYVFESNILWALEATVFLFAWLILIGASHCVKIGAHLGVDLFLLRLSPASRRIVGLIAVGFCLLFCVLLSIGAWQYWVPFATSRTWYEVNNVPMPSMLQFLADWMNAGEEYEKIPRFIPYFALPLGMTLLTLRFVQAAWRIWRGDQDMVIASHEA